MLESAMLAVHRLYPGGFPSIQYTIVNFTYRASTHLNSSIMTNSSDRINRIEQILEGLAQNQSQIVQIQRQQQEQIQVLISAATRHDALIERLDTIMERMVYREGRNGDRGNQPQP